MRQLSNYLAKKVLSELSRGQRIGTFPMILHEGRFSKTAKGTLVETTVWVSISHISLTFRENNRNSSTKDGDGKFGRPFLLQQHMGFRNGDPTLVQQKAIHVSIIAKVFKKIWQTQRAIGKLAVGGSFCACRSCEYLFVPHSKRGGQF